MVCVDFRSTNLTGEKRAEGKCTRLRCGVALRTRLLAISKSASVPNGDGEEVQEPRTE